MKRWEKALAASPFVAVVLVLGTCTWLVTMRPEDTEAEAYVPHADRLRAASEALLEKEGKPARFDQACYDEAYRSHYKYVADHPQDYPDNPDPEYQATGFARFKCRILFQETTPSDPSCHRNAYLARLQTLAMKPLRYPHVEEPAAEAVKYAKGICGPITAASKPMRIEDM